MSGRHPSVLLYDIWWRQVTTTTLRLTINQNGAEIVDFVSHLWHDV